VHRDKQAKLRDVLRASGDRCAYLNNCIREALRLFPPFTQSLLRYADEDVTLSCGVTVPRGVALVADFAAMGRRADLYERPNEFLPERYDSADANMAHNVSVLVWDVVWG
jgi:cytochrome P450